MDPDPIRLELLSAREMAEADRLTTALGISGYGLMERAGSAVADVCMSFLEAETKSRVVVLCGPGNNGGDGFVAARMLRAAGCEVTVGAMVPVARLRADASQAAQAWSGPVQGLDTVELAGADLVVDGLFGAGLARPLDGAMADFVAHLNASNKPVVAIDLPSGIDGDTGQVLGSAVEATTTVTFFRLKPGHLLLPGRVNCGRIVLADIGISADVLDEINPKALLNGPGLWARHYPIPSLEGHKYSRGHALVVSGAMPVTGAARLAARGALRIGAGLVTVASPSDALAVHAGQLTSIMVRACDGPHDLEAILGDGRKNVVVMGPGLGVGQGTRDLMEAALGGDAAGNPRSLVLDADALTSFAGDAQGLAKLISRARGPVAVTPHEGEFSRLFEHEGAEFRSASKLVRARAGAALLGTVLVLKGADTVVAEPGGCAAIAAEDAPWLATAGSGDVLAGMLGGLLAQGVPAFEAACAAVYLHVEAARQFGPGLISEDLPEALPSVLKRLLPTLAN